MVMAFKLLMFFPINVLLKWQMFRSIRDAIIEIYSPARNKDEITNDNWKTGYEQFSLLYR